MDYSKEECLNCDFYYHGCSNADENDLHNHCNCWTIKNQYMYNNYKNTSIFLGSNHFYDYYVDRDIDKEEYGYPLGFEVQLLPSLPVRNEMNSTYIELSWIIWKFSIRIDNPREIRTIRTKDNLYVNAVIMKHWYDKYLFKHVTRY